MNNRVVASVLTILCVLCGGWVSGAVAAPSVRALGGAGTYTGTTSAVSAKANGTTTTSARAGSVRVTPAVKVSSSTTPRSSNTETKASASDDQRMSIGKYLGPSVTGGVKVSGTTADDPHRNWELQLDTALIEAKGYTDTALDTAKKYTDTAVGLLVDQIGSFIGEDYLTKTDAANTYLTKTDAADTYQPKGNYLTNANLTELSSQVAANKAALDTLGGDAGTTGSVAGALAAAKTYTDEKVSGITSMPAIPTAETGQYYVLDATGVTPQWREIGVENAWNDALLN